MSRRKPPLQLEVNICIGIPDAVSNAEILRDELQDWYDNLPENFQNGEKGERLEEAITNLDVCTSLDIPECLQQTEIKYTPVRAKASRADRLQECKDILQAAQEAARAKIEELETFAQECDDVVSEWDNVEFPGMYG